MDLIGQEHSAVSWTVMTLAVVLAAVIAKTGLGVLRAYYILRVRAGEYQLYCRCWYHSSLGFEVWSALLDAVAFGLHVVANSVIFVTHVSSLPSATWSICMSRAVGCFHHHHCWQYVLVCALTVVEHYSMLYFCWRYLQR